MPRYFFDTDDGNRVYRDKDGTALASVHDAVDETRKLASDLLEGMSVIGQTTIACVVRDEGGDVVYRLTLDVSGQVGSTSDPS